MLPTINPISALACFVVFIVYVLRDKLEQNSDEEDKRLEKSRETYPRAVVRRIPPTPASWNDRSGENELEARTPYYALQKRPHMKDASVQHAELLLPPQTAPQTIPISFTCCPTCSHSAHCRQTRPKRKKHVQLPDNGNSVGNDSVSGLSLKGDKRAQVNKSLREFINQISKEQPVRSYEAKNTLRDRADSQSSVDPHFADWKSADNSEVCAQNLKSSHGNLKSTPPSLVWPQNGNEASKLSPGIITFADQSFDRSSAAGTAESKPSDAASTSKETQGKSKNPQNVPAEVNAEEKPQAQKAKEEIKITPLSDATETPAKGGGPSFDLFTIKKTPQEATVQPESREQLESREAESKAEDPLTSFKRGSLFSSVPPEDISRINKPQESHEEVEKPLNSLFTPQSSKPLFGQNLEGASGHAAATTTLFTNNPSTLFPSPTPPASLFGNLTTPTTNFRDHFPAPTSTLAFQPPAASLFQSKPLFPPGASPTSLFSGMPFAAQNAQTSSTPPAQPTASISPGSANSNPFLTPEISKNPSLFSLASNSNGKGIF